MTRYLSLASKALAVVGVLTLMWTAGGMQSAKADPPLPEYVLDCYVKNPNACGGWLCPAFTFCCNVPYGNDSGMHCCWTFC